MYHGPIDPPHPDAERALARLEAIAKLMDGAFVVPGTTIRIGLDALIGLVPALGDAAGALVSLYLVGQARALGAPRHLVARMLWNVAMDTAVGAVPVAGDMFDAMYRANMKNMALLRSHLERRGGLGRGPVIDVPFTRVSETAGR